MELEKILGDLYFKRASYVITDFNNKDDIKGIAIVCESSVQRGTVYVDVMNGSVTKDSKENFNENPATFNALIKLENPRLRLKSDGKYKITCTDIDFINGRGD